MAYDYQGRPKVVTRYPLSDYRERPKVVDGLHVGRSIAIRANKDIKTFRAMVVQAIVVTFLFLGVKRWKELVK
jgi:hypothetical protein